MTNATNAPAPFRYLDRAPIVEDTVTITPGSDRMFEVIALDDLYNELIYVAPMHPDDTRDPFWTFLTHVKVIDDDRADDTCRCGHDECGAC